MVWAQEDGFMISRNLLQFIFLRSYCLAPEIIIQAEGSPSALNDVAGESGDKGCERRMFDSRRQWQHGREATRATEDR
jgi:hypothetical protein